MCPNSDELLLAGVDSLHDGGEAHVDDPGHLQPIVSVVLAHRALEIALPAERHRKRPTGKSIVRRHPRGTLTDSSVRRQNSRQRPESPEPLVGTAHCQIHCEHMTYFPKAFRYMEIWIWNEFPFGYDENCVKFANSTSKCR